MRLTSESGGRRARRRRAGSKTTRPIDISPDMSFLEMLDVVNEGLIRQGEGRHRVRLRLPRRHLRHVQPRGQRHRARPRSRHHGLPAPHAPVQGRRHDHRSSRGARGPSPSSRISSSIAARSTASSPPAGTCRSTAAARRTATPSRFPKDVAELAMDSAACIGCGACVAACKNASAHLFMSAKISHLALLPQGQAGALPARDRR